MSYVFSYRGRPWGVDYSSDSFDSDYHPGKDSSDDEMAKVKRVNKRKRQKTDTSKSSLQKCQKTRKSKATTRDSEISNTVDSRDSLFILPPEVMLKIFQHGVESEGYTKFIPRVALVNKEWSRLAWDPSLLRWLDLGVDKFRVKRNGHTSFKDLLQHDTSQCSVLNLQGQVYAGPATLQVLLSAMPQLTSLNLSACSAVMDGESLKRIPQLCPRIQRINLSCRAGAEHKSPIAPTAALIQALGSQLVELSLANNLVVHHFQPLMTAIQENCPQLEILDLGVPRSPSFLSCTSDMAALAQGCPRIRELYLDGLSIVDQSSQEVVNGFQHLKVYSQSAQINESGDKAAFYKIFGSVVKLKLLNVSLSNMCPSLLFKSLKEVEHLNLRQMDYQDPQEFTHCLVCWCSSLKNLNLSFNKPKGDALHSCLSVYGNKGDYPLEVLDLSYSNITAKSVTHVIRCCKKLTLVDLTSCRELPRGAKRSFKKAEFQILLKLLNSSVKDNVCDSDSGTSASDG